MFRNWWIQCNSFEEIRCVLFNNVNNQNKQKIELLFTANILTPKLNSRLSYSVICEYPELNLCFKIKSICKLVSWI